MLCHHSLSASARTPQKLCQDTALKISTVSGTLGHTFSGNGKLYQFSQRMPNPHSLLYTESMFSFLLMYLVQVMEETVLAFLQLLSFLSSCPPGKNCQGTSMDPFASLCRAMGMMVHRKICQLCPARLSFTRIVTEEVCRRFKAKRFRTMVQTSNVSPGYPEAMRSHAHEYTVNPASIFKYLYRQEK